MRKFFVKIITLMLISVLCMSTLFGCKLITTNNERDMQQLVATIKIEDAPVKNIYKSDVIVAYGNYISNSGDYNTATSELFEQVIDSLIQNAVLVQYSMKYFAEKPDFAGEKWKLETYLDEDEKRDCLYNTYLKMEDFIEDYIKDKPEDAVGDTYTGTVRVTPTGAQVSTEVSVDRKDNYIANFEQDVITKNPNAFVKAINALKANDLLGDYKYDNKVENIEYFKQMLTAYQESMLVEKLQEDIEKTARSVIEYEDVVNEYKRIYQEQEDWSSNDFKVGFESVSAKSPILNAKAISNEQGKDGYGMVYHVLLKADEHMSAELNVWKEKNKNYTKSEYSAKRAEIFADIKGQDQRASWIESKYDFGATTTAIKGFSTAFTGDFTLCSEQSLPFFGDVKHLNKQDESKEDYKPRYSVDGVNKFSVDEIISIVSEYLYEGNIKVDKTNSVYTKYTADTVKENYDERVKELIFAFSQDDGDSALNTYKGYTIPGNWMPEFNEAGKELIKHNENTFMLVATDYGYHIMFFSEYFGKGYEYDSLEKYLDKEFKFSNEDIKSWEDEFNYLVDNYIDYKNVNNYMYILYTNLASTLVEHAYSNATDTIFNQYLNDSQVVVKYQEAYKDLIQK